MATVSQEFGSTKVQEAAKFCRVFNLSFSCLKLRSGPEPQKKLKRFLEVHDSK